MGGRWWWLKQSNGLWSFTHILLLILIFSSVHIVSSKQDKKLKLKDVEVLTLHDGQMTNGRRSSPVPQLTCISGGSGGCSHGITPKIVQCHNRGSDGYDIQWECKAEMDNGYKFGKIEVICEGYDYPDDPYILYGSCGLEYTLEKTNYGGGGGGGGQESKYYQNNQKWNNYPQEKSSTTGGFSTLLFMVVVVIVIYAFYKTCIAPSHSEHTDARSRTNDDFTQRPPPPPPGFRQDYFPNTGNSGNSGDYGDDSCHQSSSSRSRNTGGGLGGAGGFWTGAATGGLLGYMFGGRNNQGVGGGQYGWTGTGGPRTQTNDNNWGGRSTFGSGGSGSGSSDSGTRTTSGFGGTRRR